MCSATWRSACREPAHLLPSEPARQATIASSRVRYPRWLEGTARWIRADRRGLRVARIHATWRIRGPHGVRLGRTFVSDETTSPLARRAPEGRTVMTHAAQPNRSPERDTRRASRRDNGTTSPSSKRVTAHDCLRQQAARLGISIEPKNTPSATCRHCGKSGLLWRRHEGRWRMFEPRPEGGADLLSPHQCVIERNRARNNRKNAGKRYPSPRGFGLERF
jgi:hypothetical protein